MDKVNTKVLAEHLTTLAMLFETEAARLRILGVEPKRDLAQEAGQIRKLAERLWLTEADIALVDAAGADQPRRRERRADPAIVAYHARLPARSMNQPAYPPDPTITLKNAVM